MAGQRPARDVFEDHPRPGRDGSAAEDRPRNDLVVTGRGVDHDHDGTSALARMLREELPAAGFAAVRSAARRSEVPFTPGHGRPPAMPRNQEDLR